MPNLTFVQCRPQFLSREKKYSSAFVPRVCAPPSRLLAAKIFVTKCGMNSPVAIPSATPPWSKLSSFTVPQDFVNGPNCASPTTELESFRLFGQAEADVRLVLYRDHAGWCPYCHKVQLLVEAKKIPYIIKKVNMSCYGTKSAEFLKKVPTGLMPVIELDGKLITESMDIMFLIEDTFQMPYRQMIPVDDNDMMQSFHRYLRLERVFTGAWLGALRGPMAMLPRGVQPANQALDLIEQGLGEFVGPFFYPGDEPSLVDINFCKLSCSLFSQTPACLESMMLTK